MARILLGLMFVGLFAGISAIGFSGSAQTEMIESGQWIEDLLSFGEAGIVADACGVIDDVLSGDTERNQPEEMGSTFAIPISLYVLEKNEWISFSATRWTVRQGKNLQLEFDKYCPIETTP